MAQQQFHIAVYMNHTRMTATLSKYTGPKPLASEGLRYNEVVDVGTMLRPNESIYLALVYDSMKSTYNFRHVKIDAPGQIMTSAGNGMVRSSGETEHIQPLVMKALATEYGIKDKNNYRYLATWKLRLGSNELIVNKRAQEFFKNRNINRL